MKQLAKLPGRVRWTVPAGIMATVIGGVLTTSMISVAQPSPPLPPRTSADQVLAKVGPTTMVSVDNNVTVAGEAAYQLVLAPKSSGSLIGDMRVAIDGRHNVPLQVQVFAKRATSPAIQVGFTSISFGQSAAQNFRVHPARQHIGRSGQRGIQRQGRGQCLGQ